MKAILKLEILLIDIPGFQSPLQMLRRNRTSISLLAPLKIYYNCSTVTRLLHFLPWYSTVTWVRDELPQGWWLAAWSSRTGQVSLQLHSKNSLYEALLLTFRTERNGVEELVSKKRMVLRLWGILIEKKNLVLKNLVSPFNFGRLGIALGTSTF